MILSKVLPRILVLLLVTSCNQKKTKEFTFTLEGKINNPQSGYAILYQEDFNRKISKPIDTLQIAKDGTFKASYNFEPHVYKLQFYGKQAVTLAIDRQQQIIIKVDGDSPKIPANITGSIDTDLFYKYEAFRKESLNRLVKSVRLQISQAKKKNYQNEEEIDRLTALEVTNYSKHKDELVDFVKNEMGTSIAVYATSIRWSGEHNLSFFYELSNAFEKAHPNIRISQKIRDKVNLLRQTAIGAKAPEIQLPDLNGKETLLSTSRGSSYTLIDFWASWCPPCRKESKTLVTLHEKYHDKGFAIFGVSLDSRKKSWAKAIEKDGRTWVNVSSLEAYKTPAAYEYSVTALPINFLIDSEGKIVAKDLHGEELSRKVAELMSKI